MATSCANIMGSLRHVLTNFCNFFLFFSVLPNETPTLLHFAAFYDMKKLAKSLLRCPGALEAMSIKNSNGDLPISVANRKYHIEMGKLLETHQVKYCLVLVTHLNSSCSL